MFFEIRFFISNQKSNYEFCNLHFSKTVLNQNVKKQKVEKTNTDNLIRIVAIVCRLKSLTKNADNRRAFISC